MSMYTNGRNDYAQSYSKSYVSVNAYNTEIYTYSISLNAQFKTTGTLVQLAAGSPVLCPANRVLHVTGKRLVPGINPMNVFPAGSPLASMVSPGTLLLSVYDPITFLTGFIDPTSKTFAKYDQNLPNSFDLGTEGSAPPPLGGLGGVEVTTKLNIAPVSYVSGYIGNASIGSVLLDGTANNFGSASIITSAFNSTTSQVFLTAKTIGVVPNSAPVIRYSVPGPSTFNISSFGTAAASTIVNWIVIN